jgi:glycine cleavage system H lipoate-binding protein
MKGKKERSEKVKKNRLIGFRVEEDECIWMKTGIIDFRLCDNVFDCYNCAFDKWMQRTMSSGDQTINEIQEPGGVARLKERYQGAERPCRFALSGRIRAPKVCTMNYECYHCSFEQMMDDSDLAQLSNPPSYYLASGYKMASGYYYHLGHCWIRFEHGGRVRIGFDDFMVKLFGSLQFLVLPRLGATLKKDRVGLMFGRDDHRAVSLSPVTGTVLAVNHNALEQPEMLEEDPYHYGWLCIVEPDMPKRNLKGLFYSKESMQWIEQEYKKLLNLMGPEYERLAATGGQPVSDVFGNFPEVGWDLLVRTFLRTGG